MEGVITSADFASIMTALQNQLNVTTVVEVLAVLVGATVGLVFMWWGARKGLGVLMAAFKKGSARL